VRTLKEAWCDEDGNEKDRYDYARRYDESMARRALHEDFHATKALLSAPSVRDNFVEAEAERVKFEGRSLSPMKESFYEWRLGEYLDAPPKLYSGAAIRLANEGCKAHEQDRVHHAKAGHAQEAMEIARQRKAEREARAPEVNANPAAEDVPDPHGRSHRRLQQAEGHSLHARLAGTDQVSAYFGGIQGVASRGEIRHQDALHVALEDSAHSDFTLSRDLRRRVHEAEAAMGRPRPGGADLAFAGLGACPRGGARA